MKKLTQRHSTLHALLAGTLFLFLAVAIGAFGAHGLESRISEKLLKTYTTGVTYQFYHALALLAAAWACSRWFGPWSQAAGWLFYGALIAAARSNFLVSNLFPING